MEEIKRTLPIVAGGILLVAGTLFGASSAYGQTDTNSPQSAHANHSAGHEAHARVPGFVAPTAAVTPVPAPSAAALQAGAQTPAQLLNLLGQRIVAKDVEGIIALQEREAAIIDWDGSVIRGHAAIRAFYVEWFKSDPILQVNPLQIVEAGGTRVGNTVIGRSASVMGTYTLEQDGPDGSRVSFSGNFCDIVRQQLNGTWLYIQDNPYPPHS
ncbi:hypothetical protein AB0K20_15210 [Micromonospora matsumotoense]|uniref:YybH family protein n=1 Tax=Micromonospora matsumotoense TaxID=121616 RepID=UPI003420A152